ncbi:MAG: hypothetical protein WCG97_02930 [bacterium]
MRRSRPNYGFSFVEVLLSLAIASFTILIFAQGLNMLRINPDPNPQNIFVHTSATSSISSRGVQSNKNRLIVYYPDDSFAKRFCTISDPLKFQNIFIPQYDGFQLGNHGIVTGLKVLGTTLVASLNSATSSDPDLAIVDISNPSLLKVISSLNTGPGAAGMVVAGHYVFLANTSVNSQFQVADISNNSSPTLTASLKIPGSLSSNPKFNPIVTSISLSSNSSTSTRIFLGSQKSDLGEIFIADFNGSNLSYFATYNPSSIVNDIFANRTGVWATSPSDNELIHYTTAGNIDSIYNANGQSGNGKRIDLLGSSLMMLGRTFGHDELVQVNGPTQKIGGTIEDLLIATDPVGEIYILILATINNTSQFQIWNTTKDNFGIRLSSPIKNISIPYVSNRIACTDDGQIIFIGTASSSAPLIILQ